MVFIENSGCSAIYFYKRSVGIVFFFFTLLRLGVGLFKPLALKLNNLKTVQAMTSNLTGFSQNLSAKISVMVTCHGANTEVTVTNEV